MRRARIIRASVFTFGVFVLLAICGCSASIDKDSKALGTWYSTQILASESNPDWYHSYQLSLNDDGSGALFENQDFAVFVWEQRESGKYDVRWTQDGDIVKVSLAKGSSWDNGAARKDGFPLELKVSEEAGHTFLQTQADEKKERNSIKGCSFYGSEDQALDHVTNKDTVWYSAIYSNLIGYTTYEMRLNDSGLGRLFIRTNKVRPDWPKYADNEVIKSETMRIVEWSGAGAYRNVKALSTEAPFTLQLEKKETSDGATYLAPSFSSTGLEGCSFFSTQQEALEAL